MFAIDGVCPTSSLRNTKGNSAGEKNNEYKNVRKNNTRVKIRKLVYKINAYM